MTNPTTAQSDGAVPGQGSEAGTALSDEAHAYLRLEFELIEHMRESLVNLINQRFNFFLALVSATLVAISFLGNQLRFSIPFFLIASGLLMSVLILGLMVFARSLEGEVMLIVYIRGLNRIRNYYANSSPTIRPHLTMPWYDDVPAFYAPGYTLPGGRAPWWTKVTNLPAMIAVINSTLVTFLAVSIVQSLIQLDPNVGNNLEEPLIYLVLSALVGVLTFIATLYLQLKRIVTRLSQAHSEFHVHFKTPDTSDGAEHFDPPIDAPISSKTAPDS